MADRRPFADANALRAALQDQLFSLGETAELGLMRSYPALGGAELLTGDVGEQHDRGPGAAGSDLPRRGRAGGLRPRSTQAYQAKFGFPLIVAARELTAEQVLEQAWHRLDNSARQEHAAALIEIAKIANHRLEDKVEGTNPMGATRSAGLHRLH